MDPRFIHPFGLLISAPSGAGKTHFTLRLIGNLDEMVKPTIQRIMWCYGIYQEIFNDHPQIHFQEGLPNINDFDGKERTLLVLDDLMGCDDEKIMQLFTKISHHKNVSVIYLTQNLFYKSKHSRTISLNAHYFIIFKNVRDSTLIANLARQMYPGNSKFMIEAFADATMAPYGYLLIDLKSETDERFRLRTNIFPGETQYVYMKK